MSDCRRFESLLAGWLAGTLEGEARRQAESHLTGCPGCRELVELARLSGAAPDSGVPDLTGAVLAATSGPACAGAEELLPAHLDGELSAADRELLELHLAGCPECRALRDIMVAVEVELPDLRELAPPHGFVAAVLAATLPLDVRLARSWARWWRRGWPRLLARPRFASELAYVLTVLLVVAIQATGAFAGAEPRELLDRARKETARQVEALETAPAVGEAGETVRVLGRRAESLYGWAKSGTGTFLRRAASSLLNTDETSSPEASEETP